MPHQKIQPWRAHWKPAPFGPDVVVYPQEKGAELICDGGSAAGPIAAETGNDMGCQEKPGATATEQTEGGK
jgi:hypothetical protein